MSTAFSGMNTFFYVRSGVEAILVKSGERRILVQETTTGVIIRESDTLCQVNF